MTERMIFRNQGQDGTVELYEGDQVPEIFIDGAQGLAINGPIIKMNLFTNQIAGQTEAAQKLARREVAARLVMSLDTFNAVSQWMRNTLDELQRQGVIRQAAPPTGQAGGGHDHGPGGHTH